jgi:mannose-6-phosphate isomerase-like protein (cupin superfamily)
VIASRTAGTTSVAQRAILPGTPATPHSLTREEVFVVLEGAASVRIAGTETHARAGDAIVVPADAEFELANAGAGPLRLLCCLPVGGQARLPDGSTFTPPWAQ